MDLQDLRIVTPGETVEADVCIVGSGPAGLTIARELAGAAGRVLILESGGRDHDPWFDAANEIESVGAPRVMDQRILRNRVLGGSSSTWSGRVATFDDMDFAQRAWVGHSGWPITRHEVARYLPRSMAHLGIAFADNLDTDAMWRAVGGGMRAPKFDHRLLRDYFWSYSRDTSIRRDSMRFGPRAIAEKTLNTRCMLNATVTQIETNAAGDAVDGLEVMGLDGQCRRVRSRFNVLCAGGIENARLLLASNRTLRRGVGNVRGLVGRYLMDHPRGTIGYFGTADHLRVQRLFNDFVVRSVGRVKVSYGAALAPEIQRNEGLLNCAVWTAGPRAANDPWVSINNLLRRRGNPVRNLGNTLRNSGLVAESLKRCLIDGRDLLWRMDHLRLECIVEQCPNPDSRVTLADRRDAFGVPLSRIDWRISEQEARTVRRCGHIFVAEMKRLGLPVPTLTEMIVDARAPFFMPDVAHPTGTTRMSDNPASGVVDTNCAVFGIRGLYVAGSSTFPTCGHANPTQTIVALAVRLADHLKSGLETSGPAPAMNSAPPLERPNLRLSRPSNGRPLVLVTGASGKLGRKLTPLLIERGYSVRALTSRMPPADTDSVQWFTHDLRQADLDFRRDVDGCCAVLHLGAELRNAADMIRINAEATGALARAAEDAAVRFMCYTSTISVYGSSTASYSREDSPVLTSERDVREEYWNSDHIRMYGRTKLLGELAIRAVAKQVEYVIFRPAVIIDIADVQDVVHWNAARRALLAHRRTHHIYVLDVAEAIVWAMERSLGRERHGASVTVYNLSDDERPDSTFSKILDQAYRRLDPKPFKPVPRLPAVVDWASDYLRFGSGWQPRRPLGYMSFPSDKLRGEGYVHRHGMESVRKLAIEQMVLAPSAISVSDPPRV